MTVSVGELGILQGRILAEKKKKTMKAALVGHVTHDLHCHSII